MPMGGKVSISGFCVCHIIDDITGFQKLVHIRSHHFHEVQKWQVYATANFNLEEYNKADAFLHHMLT
jgi:hypothetical protein